MRRTTPIISLLLASGAWLGGCLYDPPPEADLITTADNVFLLGDPLVIRFSEPIKPASLEIRVWPGQTEHYTLEDELKPEVEPLLDTCTLAKSPCPAQRELGITLTLDEAGTEATVEVPEWALTPPEETTLGAPMVLEVTGALTDLQDRRKKASFFFDFQIVREIWNPYADASGGDDVPTIDAGDVGPVEPLGVAEGGHLFYSMFNLADILELPQQLYCHVRVDQLSGQWVAIMTDADPINDEVPKNTQNPEELVMDFGAEGFIFTMTGRIKRESGGLAFDSDKATMVQTIGTISFEVRDMIIRGVIVIDEVTGLSRWDGVLASSEIVVKFGTMDPEIYPAEQANFSMTELEPQHVPEDMPTVCTEAPCESVGGYCDLSASDPWPPASLCE